MDGDVVAVERMIPAAPGVIFALVSDAARHPEIDGSGTVKAVKAGAPETLSLGATFGMSMHAGIRYSMVSTVIEFEQDRRIAWQSRPGGFAGRIAAGRIWRYELEPVEGGTLVRESWDISRDKQRALLRLGGLPKKTAASMDKTLERIEGIATSTGT
jgi:Polyketide cyclase / dehydrase and lipid transport